MHRDVDGARELGDVELLGEEPLAAGFRERAVLDGVAGGLDDFQREVALVASERRCQPLLRLVGLCEGEGAAPGADDQGRFFPTCRHFSGLRHECAGCFIVCDDYRFT